MQPGNCLGFWVDLYESVALGGLGEDRRRKGLCVTDTDGLLVPAWHFTLAIDPVLVQSMWLKDL